MEEEEEEDDDEDNEDDEQEEEEGMLLNHNSYMFIFLFRIFRIILDNSKEYRYKAASRYI